jgi:hypothetical protein
MWGFNPAEIVELVRLAKANVPGGAGRALHEGKTAFPNGVVYLRTAFGKLSGLKVRGEERNIFLRRDGLRQ